MRTIFQMLTKVSLLLCGLFLQHLPFSLFFHIFQLTRSSYSVFFVFIDSFHSMAVEYGFVIVARLLFMKMKFFNMQISIGLHILSLGFAILITSVHIITISHIPSLKYRPQWAEYFFIQSLGCQIIRQTFVWLGPFLFCSQNLQSFSVS